MLTKLAVCSDLHFDTYPHDDIKIIIKKLEESLDKADVLIIAGDMVNGIIKNEKLLLTILSKKILNNCIIVPGNHDYWGGTIEDLKNYTGPLRSNILISENRLVNGMNMFGGTLWYHHTPIMDRIGSRWPDVAFIADNNKIFEEHDHFKKKLIESTSPIDIVVSHHLPTHRSVHPTFANASNNCYFVTNQDDIIMKVAPKLWIHGHTHHTTMYKFGETTIVCNPLGYPNENSLKDWKPIILEV